MTRNDTAAAAMVYAAYGTWALMAASMVYCALASDSDCLFCW